MGRRFHHVGGFMGSGTPHRLVDELVRQARKKLTLITNDTARPGAGVGKLIDAGLVERVAIPPDVVVTPGVLVAHLIRRPPP